MRRVVGKLKEVAPTLTEDHRKVHRPWGSYQSLDQDERYQVKRIVVKQGGRLSPQIHQHRIQVVTTTKFSAPGKATSCLSVATKS